MSANTNYKIHKIEYNKSQISINVLLFFTCNKYKNKYILYLK